MPARSANPNEILLDHMHKLRKDVNALQQQQTTVLYDPTGMTGDPANQYAVVVSGALQQVTGITGFGLAVWDQTTSAWVELPASTLSPATTVTGPDAFGAPSVVGTSTHYAREDHDHGLPSLGSSAPLGEIVRFIIGGSGTVTAPTSLNAPFTMPSTSRPVRVSLMIPRIVFSAITDYMDVTVSEAGGFSMTTRIEAFATGAALFGANHVALIDDASISAGSRTLVVALGNTGVVQSGGTERFQLIVDGM